MNHLIIISGPGGSGKDAVIDQLIKDPDLHLTKLVSWTSRPPRLGETDGAEYHFLTRPQFESAIKNHDLLEYEIMASNQNYYGTPKNDLIKLLEKTNVICAKMPVGALALKNYFQQQAVTIFIDANDGELKRRLNESSRQHELKNIQRRLKQGREERKFQPQYDLTVMNHDGQLDQTVTQVNHYLRTRLTKTAN